MINAELEFGFSQDVYSVSEGNGNVSVCIEILTNGTLPRSVELNILTQEGSALGDMK